MFDILKLNPLADRVVDSVHASFPDHHSKEDTKSSLWVWLIENRGMIESMIRNSPDWEGNLYYMMVRAANQHLREEDQATYNYSAEDVFNYPLDLVRELLLNVFNYADWQSFGDRGDGQPKAKGLANATGDHVAMYVDIKSAFGKLPVDQQLTLLRVYRDQWSAEGVGEELGISTEAAKKRVSRAVAALQRRLGSKPYSSMRQGFSGRRVPSGNLDALAQTEREYEG